MVLDADILTGDSDFLGSGCPTWTVELALHACLATSGGM